jgi:3D (Asp-Asp-Asp) domain-containing protein
MFRTQRSKENRWTDIERTVTYTLIRQPSNSVKLEVSKMRMTTALSIAASALLLLPNTAAAQTPDAVSKTLMLPAISQQELSTMPLMAKTMLVQHAAMREHAAAQAIAASAPAATKVAPVARADAASQVIAGRNVQATLHLTATAYAPTYQDNYPYGPVDYYGRPLVAGDIAVDPRVIPLGTLLWVTGYASPDLPSGGFLARAVDTGGAIQGNRIDIFINQSESEVSNFGVQQVTAYVLQ